MRLSHSTPATCVPRMAKFGCETPARSGTARPPHGRRSDACVRTSRQSCADHQRLHLCALVGTSAPCWQRISHLCFDTFTASGTATRPWFFSSWSAAASNAHHRNVAVPCCRALMVLSECVGAQPEVSGPPSMADPCGHQTSMQLWRRVRGFVAHPSQRSMSSVDRVDGVASCKTHGRSTACTKRKQDDHNHTRETPHPEGSWGQGKPGSVLFR